MADAEKTYREAMNAGHSAAWDLDWARAAAHYRRALEAKPGDYQALTSLGLALFEQRRFDEALKAYLQAAQAVPEDPVPWEKMAQIYEREGALQNAVNASLKAAERFMKRGEVQRGIDNYLRAIRLAPENLTAHARLALIYDRLKQVDLAAEEYLAVASLLQRQGKVEEATQAAKRALKLLPSDPKVQQAMAALKQGVLLPLPQRPKGGTNPLRMAKIRQVAAESRQQQKETAAREKENEPEIDPITRAWKRALTQLAEVLFEQAEEGEGEGRSRALDALMVSLTSPDARSRQRARILQLLGQVVDEQTRGNYAQAAEELRRAIDAGIDHAAAYFDLGYLLSETGQFKEALHYLQKALAHPDFALAGHLLAARAYMHLGKKGEAAQHYLEALRQAEMAAVSPEQADALGQLYEPLIAQVGGGVEEETVKRIAENVEQMLARPDWLQTVRTARAQLVQERSAGELLPLADMLMEAQSGRIVEALETVNTLVARRAWGAALEEAQMALNYAPAYLPLHALMADILQKRGLTEAALEKYLIIARTYLARGNAQRAVELYRKVLDIDPTHIEAHARLIDALMQQNRIEDAIAHYMEMAEFYYQLAELEHAEQIYEKALRLARRLPNGRLWQLQIMRQLADLAEQRLDWRQAALMYEQIRTLEPEDENIRSSLIQIQLRLGKVAQAVKEIDEYIAYLQKKDALPKALHFLNDLAEAHPEIGDIHLRLGQIYTTLGHKHEAIAAYDTAGEKFLDEGRVQDAIRAVEAILALNPPDADAYREALEQLRAQMEG